MPIAITFSSPEDQTTPNLLQHLAKVERLSGLHRLAGGALLALLALAPAANAAEQAVTFRGVAGKIFVDGNPEIRYLGGDASTADADLLLLYTNFNAAANTLRTLLPIEARVLIVGGGGAGGYGTNNGMNPGGGGGGGEVKELENVGYQAATYSMVVGAGGAATLAKGNGENGHPTTFMMPDKSITVLGGGGGGCQTNGNGGDDVATGGGGGGNGKTGGVGTLHKGGKAINATRAGGGGGADGDGLDSTATKAGDGGAGYKTDITNLVSGVKVGFGGGGGGAQSANNTVDYIGLGVDGGGNGGCQNTIPGKGMDGFGGGGGGGGRALATHASQAFNGGAGGSGVVIIRITKISVPKVWKAIDVSAGGNDGKIFVDENANYEWKGGDLLITYTNTTVDGGLRFYDPGDPSLPPVWANARVLVVGGGGGGGFIDQRIYGGGAGGGGGGFVEKSDLVFDNSAEFSISVGAGGKGGSTYEEAGDSGKDSSIKGGAIINEIAAGGGGGGAHTDGADGGSGGGASRSPLDTHDRYGGEGKNGQGFKGGDALANSSGAGGGGAGGVGGNAANLSPGVGGAGKACDIVGSNVVYAAGGGGAFVNASDKSSPLLGGKGGSDGVGGDGAGLNSDKSLVPAKPGKDGTGSGGGGGTTHSGGTSPAGKGGDGVVIIRLSGFVVKNIPVPDSRKFTYDATEKRGVDEFFAYDLSGEPTGTDARFYTVTLKISDRVPATVEWGDAEGGRGDRTVVWEINQMEVEVPKVRTDKPDNYFIYSEATKGVSDKKQAVRDVNGSKTNGGVDTDGNCWTNTAAGVSVKFCSLTGYIEQNAGTYKFTAALWTDGGTKTNFIWAAPKTMNDQSVDWKIAQATNTITNLTLDDWQYGVEKTDQPNATSTFKNATDPYVYTYHKGDREPRTPEGYELGEEKPTEPGVYWVRVSLSKDTEHTEPHQFGNWGACEASKRFCIWRHPTDVLQDYVDILVDGYAGGTTTLTDFPVLIHLREPLCDNSGAVTNGLPGFTYANAGVDGSELRFVSLENDAAYKADETTRDRTKDALIPYEVETWNTKGESLVWVKVPKIKDRTTKFRMYWHRRPGETVIADKLASETWSDYKAVLHLNETDGTYTDSTGNGLVLTGAVEQAANPLLGGGAVYVPDTKFLIAENYREVVGDVLAPFFYTGWYRGDTYNGSGNYSFVGDKLAKDWNTPGWSFFMNANKTRPGASGSGNTWSGYVEVSGFTTEWTHLAYSVPASGQQSFYANGGNAKNFTQAITDSGNPFAIVRGNFAADEVRVRKTIPQNVTTWVKAEYDSIHNVNFCKFGLVNQLQPDDARAWVNFWSVAPWARAASGQDPTGRYWAPGELTQAKAQNWYGMLAKVWSSTTPEGSVSVAYFKMPGHEPVAGFPDTSVTGAYQIEFSMANAGEGTTAFPRKHVIFEGDRMVDIEIVGDAPQPIDPTGAGTNLRVLLANDDTNPAGQVSNQEYAVWHHLNDDYSESFTNNLLPGTEHELTNAVGTVLWKLTDVYLGNVWTTNAEGQATLLDGQLTLPCSATAVSTNNIVLRNMTGAEIVSPWYTNGIGTIYFDAVNGWRTNGLDSAEAAYRLVVEISTNEVGDAEWTPLSRVISMKGNDVVFGTPVTDDVIDLTVSSADGGTYPFYRVIAKVGSHQPMRFRIRRAGELDEEGSGTDDIRGFIIVDNVIASWPTGSTRLTSPGWYDAKKAGKQTLGMEKAFSVDFPTAANSNDLTVAAVFDGGIDVASVASARLYYRWRYLNGSFEPAQTMQGGKPKANWKVCYLDPSADFRTSETLKLPGKPGDVEYWFDLTAIIPYYKFVDYSGSAYAKPTGDYTEDPAKGVTSRFSDEESYPGGTLPSLGTDWFVRLRDGVTELESMVLVVKGGGEIPMELVDDHVWRGYVKTPAAVKGGLDWHVEVRNWQDPSTADFLLNTNIWYAESVDKLPMSAILKKDGTASDWANVPVDAATGYLMFQVDDRSRSVSVVHSDYQDFNLWDDARSDTTFSGSSAEDGAKSGVSPKKRALDETFVYRGIAWEPTPDVKRGWEETFDTASSLEYGDYVPFGSASTPEGWKSGPGMFVNQWYKYATAIGGLPRRALQMEGSGKGYLQFPPTPDNVPRGIGTFSFQARLGQFIDLDDDVSYAEVPNVDTAVTKNYTFVSLAAFDTEENKGFSGNASLSLFAYYRARVGAYELRYEQVGANVSGTSVTGPSNQRRLSLYKWQADSTGKMTSKRLGYSDVWNYQVKTAGLTGKYIPFYISCSNELNATVIKVGMYRDDTGSDKDKEGFSYNAAMSTLSDKYFYNYVYRDTKEPLKRGTYGVLTANCDGLFLRPHVGREPLATAKTQKDQWVDDGSNNKVAFPALNSCEDDIRDLDDEDIWNCNRGRMATFWNDHYLWGIEAKPLKQGLELQISPRGKTPSAWTVVDTYEITSFGSAGASGKTFTTRLDRSADYDVRLKVTSAMDDARTDIIVDNLKLTQWRGCDYGVDDEALSFIVPKDASANAWATNFTFTSAWVKNEVTGRGENVRTNATVLLSAKRTAGWATGAKVCGLRSPVYDNLERRGLGLGSISFVYRNAQENARLLVQIATNANQVTANQADLHNTVDNEYWTTVTNVDFSAMYPEERLAGRVDVSLGLHGVQGMMRVIVDPAVVEQVSPTTWLDEKKYGEVEIERIYCRDEPPLDLLSWWGWNLQTTANATRQYLPDGLLGTVPGLSFGLNNSTTLDVEPSLYEYADNMPFVQTPSFLTNIVGQVSFKARKYVGDENSQPAEVVLYGACLAADGHSLDWHTSSTDVPLARFVISNTYYTSYSYKTRPGENYNAFRLGVGGVPEVKENVRGASPTQGVLPVRVMLDEVCVSEAIRPQVGFRYCYAVRDGLTDNLAATNVGERESQPIMGDAWTVQAEIEKRLLPDEIDLTTPGHEPKVFFHWYCGESPWGYQQWKGKDGAKTAELTLAEGEKMVFRGSYLTSPNAVVMAEPATASYTYRIYQYAADVVYWDTKGNCITGSLERGEWARPEWYAPLDLNRKNGGNAENRFAGYNILESVAPGRAWINEVNVFDGKDMRTYEYPASTNQYIEVAVPLNQSLRNWKLKVIDEKSNTNDLCIIGQGDIAESKTVNAASNYVFVTVQSPLTKEAKTLSAAAGEVDGTWNSFTTTDTSKGELDQLHPIGLQLIRPSGIIAQELVLMGTNTWIGTAYEEQHSPERRAEQLNAADAEKQWIVIGNECGGTRKTSLGVTNIVTDAEHVWAMEPKEVWTNRRDKTPGRINVGQVIPADWAIYPSGDMVLVNATVTGAYLGQTVGEATNTTATVTVVTKKEGDGTNILYRLANPWYEIGEIRENGVVKYTGGGRDGFVWAAAKGATESVVTVTATSRPLNELREKYGLTEKNPYTDAVMDWLTKGKRLDGTKFEYPGAIDLPKVLNLADNVVTNLTLTETYWFDIDPTGSNWCWKAGTSLAPHEYTHVTTHGETKTNVQIGVYMVITNRSTEGVQAGKSWSPYVLRGKIPGTHSQQYAKGETNKWDSVNFKMTGDIQNDRPLRTRWVPLRYFVFDENSFDENHQSIIDIPYPYSSDSLSVNYGWDEYPGCQIFYSWWIDDRNAPVAIETLRPTNIITW